MTNLDLIRGRQQVTPLTNKSGGERVEGDVVIVDTTTDDSFNTTTTSGNKMVVGVVAETIANNEEGRVINSGYVPTLKVSAATNRGDWLKTSTIATKAVPNTDPEEGAFAFALSSTVGEGTVSAFIFPGGTVAMAGVKGDTGDQGPPPDGVLILTARGGAPRTDSGCATPEKIEIGTINHIDKFVLAFDKDSDEFAQWSEIVMPTDWNGGTITTIFVWTCSGGGATQTVCWGLRGRSWGDDEAIDQALGTAQFVTDTWLANKDVHISAQSAAITLAGTPAAGELIVFEIQRDISEDDLDCDGLLIAAMIGYTRS